MGRQAYLAKIAFGRSAFEPALDVTQSNEYIQLESANSELPSRYQAFDGNNYLQLYDERGNPINPRARDYGKKLRNAQNDVLAAVGVVERRHFPPGGLLGAHEQRQAAVDAEDTAGNALALTFTVVENVCTWWIGIIRDRLLMSRYPDAASFAQLVASEFDSSGRSIMYAGFVPRAFSTMCSQTILYSVLVHRPLERLLHVTRATSKTRKLFQRSRYALVLGLRLGLEVLFYPLSYHANLQRMGLVPSRPFLPPWRDMMPCSSSAPRLPLSFYYDPSASAVDFVKAIVTSPLILVCVEQLYEYWIHAIVSSAVDACIIRPDNPDGASPDAESTQRTYKVLGLRQQPPRLIQNAVSKLLLMLGWAAPRTSDDADDTRQAITEYQPDSTEPQTIDVAGTTVTNAIPLQLPVAQPPEQQLVEANEINIAVNALARPSSPESPIVRQNDSDPRIRITRRDGIVEMEVRLPPRIVSTHSEVTEAPLVSQSQRSGRSRHEALKFGDQLYYRVTALSVEPSEMAGTIVKSQVVALAVLPLKMIAFRLIASHYLARQGGHANPLRSVKTWSTLSDLSWRSFGTQVSHLALCTALEVAIDFGLWGLHYVTTVRIGTSLSGWGTL